MRQFKDSVAVITGAGAGLGKAIGSFKREVDDVRQAGTDLTRNLPGVQEAAEAKETLDKARNLTRLLRK